MLEAGGGSLTWHARDGRVSSTHKIDFTALEEAYEFRFQLGPLPDGLPNSYASGAPRHNNNSRRDSCHVAAAAGRAMWRARAPEAYILDVRRHGAGSRLARERIHCRVRRPEGGSRPGANIFGSSTIMGASRYFGGRETHLVRGLVGRYDVRAISRRLRKNM